jgi:signal transduction histidine kinase
LRRLRELQAAGDAISQGDLKRRMPTSRHRDELDLFAATVNHMMDEVERLMSEVQGATDIIAHDLLMPLTRARTRLSRILQSSEWDMEQAARVGEEIDGVLDRFRAILRISQMDIRDRRAGFASIDLNDIVAPVAELYEPLAEAAGVTLSLVPATVTKVHADPKLMVEALSNLVDNAIKFTRSGGNVRIELLQAAGHPRIIVEDDGPGISPDERGEFMQKFRSVKRTSTVPGSGIGLSVVAAIVRLHGFRLRLQDGAPGLRAVIDCGNAESPPEAVGAREG